MVNLVAEKNAEAMNLTCIDAPPGIDELALAGLTPARVHGRGRRGLRNPPFLRCRTLTSLVTGPGRTIAISGIVYAHVDEAVMDTERCYIDSPAIGLVGRMHGTGWYAR